MAIIIFKKKNKKVFVMYDLFTRKKMKNENKNKKEYIRKFTIF